MIFLDAEKLVLFSKKQMFIVNNVEKIFKVRKNV